MGLLRLILAERSTALQKVLQAGLERYDFQVTPVRTLEAALAAASNGDVRALLLDGDLIAGASLEWNPRITLILMGEGPPEETPCLWIRKPFDPALLAEFLRRRYARKHPTENRRRFLREPARGAALVLVERTGFGCYTEVIDHGGGGCSLYSNNGEVVGDCLQVLLRDGSCDRGSRAIVKHVRLAVTPDGELRRAIGVQFLDGIY